MEIGKFIDFHLESTPSRDYDGRIQGVNGGGIVLMPTKDGTMALTSDVTTEANARIDADSALNTTITNHVNNKSNPHGVTKAQVGLGNVANFFYDASYSTSEPAETQYATNLSCYHLYQDLNNKKQNVLDPRNGICMGLIIGSTKYAIGIYLFTKDITVY